MTTEECGLRSDAAARREQVLRAAARLFADQGFDVPMQRVAREAGVGVGTLYRRFPDRDALVVAVIVDGLGRVRERIDNALMAQGLVWEAFLGAMDPDSQDGLGLTGQLARNPEVARMVREHPGFAEAMGQVMTAFDDLVVRAQSEGSIRRDVSSGDVVMLLRLAGRTPAPPGTPRGTRLRQRALVLAGLSPTAGAPLPGAALGATELWR